MRLQPEGCEKFGLEAVRSATSISSEPVSTGLDYSDLVRLLSKQAAVHYWSMLTSKVL